jgi:hypothetical protein
MEQRTIEALNALKERLEKDIRNSRQVDPDGLSQHSPLMRNLEQVKKDIATLKESK